MVGASERNSTSPPKAALLPTQPLYIQSSCIVSLDLYTNDLLSCEYQARPSGGVLFFDNSSHVKTNVLLLQFVATSSTSTSKPLPSVCSSLFSTIFPLWLHLSSRRQVYSSSEYFRRFTIINDLEREVSCCNSTSSYYVDVRERERRSEI